MQLTSSGGPDADDAQPSSSQTTSIVSVKAPQQAAISLSVTSARS